MNIALRIAQIFALAAGVAGFIVWRASDPIPPGRWELFLGCAICGFGAMWLTTYIIVLARHGRRAAASLEWY